MKFFLIFFFLCSPLFSFEKKEYLSSSHIHFYKKRELSQEDGSIETKILKDSDQHKFRKKISADNKLIFRYLEKEGEYIPDKISLNLSSEGQWLTPFEMKNLPFTGLPLFQKPPSLRLGLDFTDEDFPPLFLEIFFKKKDEEFYTFEFHLEIKTYESLSDSLLQKKLNLLRAQNIQRIVYEGNGEISFDESQSLQSQNFQITRQIWKVFFENEKRIMEEEKKELHFAEVALP